MAHVPNILQDIIELLSRYICLWRICLTIMLQSALTLALEALSILPSIELVLRCFWSMGPSNDR